MLELHDPLWDKLGEHVPTIISKLAASWDEEAAKSPLYDDLCHQETSHGATYAAIPHLLKIAELDENRYRRWEIAVFVGFVALCAREGYRQGPGALRGLHETLEGWERTSTLVNAADLEKILSIKASFLSAWPAIRTVCERALLENDDAEVAPYLLSGIAAADGLLSIARLLHDGDEGWFACSSCGSDYGFLLRGDWIAVYGQGIAVHEDDDILSDDEDRTTSRAGGFIAPIGESEVLDVRITGLLSASSCVATGTSRRDAHTDRRRSRGTVPWRRDARRA